MGRFTLLDRFLNRVRVLFGIAKCALAWTLVIFAIAFLAFLSLQDVIEAAKECHTFNVFNNCVEERLRNL